MFTALALVNIPCLAESSSLVSAEVASKIKGNKATDTSSLTVTTVDGVVILSGNVPTEIEAITIIETAMNITGVKDVDTEKLMITNKASTAGESSSTATNNKSNHPEYSTSQNVSQAAYQDIFITAKIKGLFAREKLHGNESQIVKLISIETKNGVVTLLGTATKDTQKQNTINRIKDMKGVKDLQLMIEKKY